MNKIIKKKMVRFVCIVVLCGLLALVTGCSQDPAEPIETMRIGMLKNISHAPALVARAQERLEQKLGKNVTVEWVPFNNGTELAVALATNKLEAGYMGPGPAAVFYARSQNYQMVAGAVNGGAQLVVRKGLDVNSVADLRGRVVAVPAKGNTQELSMLLLMEEVGLKDAIDGSGVEVINRPPDQMMISLRQKQIDAALVPEPWATMATTGKDAPANVLLTWDQIPPGNANVPTTILVANHRLIHYHEDVLQHLLDVNQETIDWMEQHPEDAIALIQEQLKQLTGKKISSELLRTSYGHMKLNTALQPVVIKEMSDAAVRAGYIRDVKSLDGLIQLPTPLN